MSTRTRRAASRRPVIGSAPGMSLIEVLIAMALMAVIAVSLIPLFTRSVRQNREGANYMDLTNIARSALEEYLQLDFNAPQLTLADGALDRVVSDYWDPASRSWQPMPADPATLSAQILWERTIQVHQFSSADLVTDGRLDTPLPGGTTADRVQLKRIRVMVRPRWRAEWALGRPTPVSLHVLKAV